MTRGAEPAHVERLTIVVTEKAVAFLRRVPDERRESFVGHLDAVVTRGGLPDATLEALAVDEQAVHVADNGDGAATYHGVDSFTATKDRRANRRTRGPVGGSDIFAI